MQKLPPLNSLKAFYVVSKHQNFSRAAEELHVTPGAISQQIRQLEAFMGRPLFKRLPRGVELNAEGRKLIYEVQRAFGILENAAEQIWRPQEKAIVNITTVASIAARWIVPALENFQKKHPMIDVRISTNQQLVSFEKEDFDLGIRYGRGKWTSLESEFLPGSKKIVVCSPGLLTKNNQLKTLNDLKFFKFIFDGSYNDWKDWLEKAGVPNLEPRAKLELDEMNVAIQAAIEDQGLLLVHKILVKNDLEAGRLIEPFDVKLSVETGYYIVYPNRRFLSKPSLLFVEWIKGQTLEN